MAPSLPPALLLIALISTTLLPSLGSATAGCHDQLTLDRFHRWMSAYGRSYRSADEKLRRLEVYHRNVEFIEASNRNAEKLGYELGENQFTDLTNEEFVAKYASGTPPPLPENDIAVTGDDDDMIITTLAGKVSEGRSNVALPVEFDWRAEGAVTRAKQQGLSCGSCWAFTAVAMVESLIKIKGGDLLDLSEQELLDCDKAQLGCRGGWAFKALEWIKAKGGLVPEAEYPYVGKVEKCKDLKSANRTGKITGVKAVKVRSEAALAAAVFETPVAVTMDAKGDILQHYKSGVYKGPCSNTWTNHAVVFIGWGVDKDNVKYWIVKNSWGENWGQNGFFFMRKEADGANGLCGITRYSSFYPTM